MFLLPEAHVNTIRHPRVVSKAWLWQLYRHVKVIIPGSIPCSLCRHAAQDISSKICLIILLSLIMTATQFRNLSHSKLHEHFSCDRNSTVTCNCGCGWYSHMPLRLVHSHQIAVIHVIKVVVGTVTCTCGCGWYSHM